MEYLVIWIWLQSVIVPCPQPPIVYDQFGRYHESHTTTLQLCYETTSIRQERYFDKLQEAQKFIEEGEKEDDLADFELKILDDKQ